MISKENYKLKASLWKLKLDYFIYDFKAKNCVVEKRIVQLLANFKMWGRNFICLLLVINRYITDRCIFYPINLTQQELCNSRRLTAVRSNDVYLGFMIMTLTVPG